MPALLLSALPALSAALARAQELPRVRVMALAGNRTPADIQALFRAR